MLACLDQVPHIYLACGKTDLRKGIDGLAQLVQEKFHLNPFSEESLFLFCGSQKDRIKGLLWEGDGFLLLYKRVENGHFDWPRNSSEVRELTTKQYHSLLEGFSVEFSPRIKKCFPHQI